MILPRLFVMTAIGGALLSGGAALADYDRCAPAQAERGLCGYLHFVDDSRTNLDYGYGTGPNPYDRSDFPHYDERGDGPYQRGDRFPRDRYSVIDDYDRYGWRRPARNERYVDIEGQRYLADTARGIILEALGR